ncbi:MAG: DUF1016 N-terminal domain-containing protein [Sulfuricellaceae bacterium]|nr:DUF1016 N-terminal domain-containing protein [Sulfuricellaceae bacterium]
MSQSPQDTAYTQLYAHIRQLVLDARQAVSRAVDTCQVMASFEIGRHIVEHEQQGAQRAEYGKQVLKELAHQLTGEFGRGFSRSNLEYMRKFFLIYRDRLPEKSQMPSGKSQPAPPHKSQMLSGILPEAVPIVQRPVAQMPFRLGWSQYVFLIPARRAKHRHMLRMGYDL